MFTPRTDRLAALALGLLVSGCADYMNRRDTASLGAGNAMEANMGIHTVNPFPRAAYNTRIEQDGQAAVAAQERYVIPSDSDVVISGATSGE